ncbi:winged helix-turn-helix domain-containing protein [Deinococcus proteolyticus]|uniref:winged helix-turn-helix domain-containing protein n=1 Tax=Deinococcus proteolyticus TaxID=55148 RepID=UPI001FDEB97D|nr:winged helix-turn-helix domain-containing protein [Deinococcus proteolyticus]
MTLSAWRPARLSRTQQEERRLAAQPLLNDPDWSTRDLARHFGVAEVTIRAWRARIRHGGEEALRASRATGRPEFLTPDQQKEIQDILESDPRLHGFETSGWTVPKVRQVIGLKYGVWIDRAHLSRKLRRWGFSYQRPALRAVERNEEDIAAWVRLQKEALEKKRAEGAGVFTDGRRRRRRRGRRARIAAQVGGAQR